MEITRNNYEAYFIDYMEGNLDARLVDDFIEFLQQNPDLKEELAMFEAVSIDAETISFNKKETLYKHKYDSEKAFNEAAVASLEGDISNNEKAEFEKYLSTHPEKQKDITRFAQTKLLADESIIFTKKSKLFHYSLGRKVFFWSGRVAAVLILAFSIFYLIDTNSNKIIPSNQVAVVQEKNNEQEVASTTRYDKPNVQNKTQDKNPVNKEQKAPKAKIKQINPAKKTRKHVPENKKERITNKNLIAARMPVNVPNELESLTASLPINTPAISLATMNHTNTEIQQTIYEERLLADVVKEKTGIEKFKFSKITKAGLNLVSSFTRDNFTYETDEKGKVTEFNYDSRLLAFSIPNTRHGANQE